MFIVGKTKYKKKSNNQYHLGPLGDHPYESFKTDNVESQAMTVDHPRSTQKKTGGLSSTVRQ